MAFPTLEQLTASDAIRVGGKAWNCARLKQHGFPVPEGIVVPAATHERELAAIAGDPWLDRWPAEQTFAVRSSGVSEDGSTQSFAGINETLLDVPRATIASAVLTCMASAQSARAQAYRRAQYLPDTADAIAVLIQRMIRPVAAGVGFTIDPLASASDELVINSTFGLGDALVSGEIDPDEIRVRKSDRTILTYNVGRGTGASASRSLTDQAVAELSELLIAIEQHCGSPQDVEWCFDGSRFWIVQSRPVTAVEHAPATEWSRANLAEVLPELTSPQTLVEVEHVLNVAEHNHLGRLLGPVDVLGPMVKAFNGRLYFNLSQFRHLCRLSGTPPALMLRSLGHAGDIDPADEVAAPRPLRELIACTPDFVRIGRKHMVIRRLVRNHREHVEEVVGRLTSTDPTQLSSEQIWTMIGEWRRDAPQTLEVVLVLGGVLFYEVPLRHICERVGYSFERLLYAQLAAGERSVSAQQAFDLVALAQVARNEPRAADWLAREELDPRAMRRALDGTAFLAAFDRFIAAYGHRGPHETDWALPRYGENPGPILEAVRMHLGSDIRDLSAQQRRADAAAAAVWKEFEERFRGLQRWTLLPRAKRAIRMIKQYYVWRELCRFEMVRVVAAIRRWHLVLADSFVQRGWIDERDDYFFLHIPEVADALQQPPAHRELAQIVAQRKTERARYARMPMPLLMRESDLPRLTRAAGIPDVADVDDANDLQGLPVSSGCVRAEVVVLHDPTEFARMKRGAILVARATDPSWTPLFTLASGVIVEVGGVLSHASTIAREYGLPALANVRNATRRLRDGEMVTLDATNGVVRRER